MGAKRRMPVKTTEQSAIDRELEVLAQVLDIIDHTVKEVPKPSAAQEQKHRVLLRDYLVARVAFRGAREVVINYARTQQYVKLPAALESMDFRERQYEIAESQLKSFREELES